MIYQLGSAIDLFIHPGEFEFADENFCLRTTLGSCVAITLWHPQRKLGGMCHYMLPHRLHRDDASLCAKYADEAMALLLDEVRKANSRLEHYQVKLFGGGNMFSGGPVGIGVARRNIEAARQLMAAHGLHIQSESLGGSGYRNVVFDIARGDVWVRHVGVGQSLPDAEARVW